MNGYKATISLRFFGVSSGAGNLVHLSTKILKGTLFSQREGYICYCLFSADCFPGELEEEIFSIGTKLLDNKDALESCGYERGELFIGLFMSNNVGFELSPEIMSTFSALNLGLSLDIYP